MILNGCRQCNWCRDVYGKLPLNDDDVNSDNDTYCLFLYLLQAQWSGTHYRLSFMICLLVLVFRCTLNTILFVRY